MKKSFYERYAFYIILAAIFFFPFAGLGARRALLTNRNDVKQWLPDTYEETQIYARFQKDFPGEEFVLVSWEGCTLSDHRLPLLARKLLLPDGAKNDPNSVPLFDEVVTGPAILKQMTSEPLLLERELALNRLKGSLIGHNGVNTCLLVTLSDAGTKSLRRSIDMIYETASEQCAIPAEDIRMGGPPVDNVAIDKAGEATLIRLAGMSAIIGLAISWWSLRSWKLVAIVMMTGIYTIFASMAIVWYSNTPMNAILLSMPSLVYVAAVSGAIHLSNYYRDTVREEGLAGAPGRAVKHAMLPLGLATVTTSVGLMSLIYSELVPIQLFGIFSAIGVVIGFILLVFLLPAALTLFPIAEARTETGDLAAHEPTAADRFWWSAGQWVLGRSGRVALACLAVMAFCALGLPQIKTSVHMMRFFKGKAPILRDYAWLEEKLGELVPMEIVIRVNEQKSGMTFLDSMRLVKRVQERVNEIPDVGSSLSLVTFAPPIPPKEAPSKASGVEGVLGRLVNRDKIRNKNLLEHREDFLKSDYLREDKENGDLLFRISARVGALKDVDYAEFINVLKQDVDPIIEEASASAVKATGKPEAKLAVVYTGLVPIVYKAQNSLLDGLIFGFITDLVIIVIVMMIAVRSVSAGLLLSATSVFPAVIVFGTMGWLGWLVDVGTVMTPAVALGVTVDDVVHYLLWYKRGIAQGLSRKDAVMLAYKGCARAMYQSWGVIGLGLSVFALSPFTPTQRFGLMMLTLLTAALPGNLLLLPALLVGPLGRFFGKPPKPGTVPVDQHGAKSHGAQAASPAPESQPAASVPHAKVRVATTNGAILKKDHAHRMP
jgi:uncharacterized protein